MDTLTPLARDAFVGRFGAPTAIQRLAWPALAAGKSVLCVAPTGSGKTLAAFYAFLDRLVHAPAADGIEVVYVSPLKALAADVERNLRVPLAALEAIARERGVALHAVPVGVRSGDTPAAERARMVRRPPRILVTTPESLYLLLTSPRSRATLAATRVVIVDELHALAETKRGGHLLLSLERLEGLCGRPLQRVGLSATVAPAASAAAWLAGSHDDGTPRPIEVLDAGERKPLELTLERPADPVTAGGGTLWPAIAARVIELVATGRSTLIFANSRRVAERVTAHVNSAAGRELAACHHGSVARERRLGLEVRLKAGELEALVATSSLELGIDVGALDRVIQLGSPRGVSRGLQRAGRAGHSVGETARATLIQTSRGEALELVAIAIGMRAGDVEPLHLPRGGLDVLAQQIVAEVASAGEPLDARALHRAYRRASPYRGLGWDDLAAVLDMLAGRYARGALRELAPRLDWDRRRGILAPLPGSRALAVANAGTIPDRGLYRAELEGTRERIGELDEEFVTESRVGDVFVLGTTSWRVTRITRDRVIVTPAPAGEPGKVPFWRGEGPGRPPALGARVGALARRLDEALAEGGIGRAASEAALSAEAGADAAASSGAVELVAAQRAAGVAVPTDRRVVVELHEDDVGEPRLAILTPWGRRVHAAWALALGAGLRARGAGGTPILPSDDGILVRLPAVIASGLATEDQIASILRWTPAAAIAEVVAAEIEGSPLYAALFREAAQRSLLFARGFRRGRTPLWLARQRSADLEQVLADEPGFPVAREARREALEDVLDVGTLVGLLDGIEAGTIEVRAVRRALPSPMAAELGAAFTLAFLYEGDSPRLERRVRALAAGRDAAARLLSPEELEGLLDPDAVAEEVARRQHTAPGTRARTSAELAEILRRVGELREDEVAPRVDGDPAPLIADLRRAGRVIVVEIAGGPRLVLDEDDALWREAREPAGPGPAARLEIVRRYAATHGPFGPEEIATRTGLAAGDVATALATLEQAGLVARGRFLRRAGDAGAPGAPGAPGDPAALGPETWADRANLAALHRRSIARLRDHGAPVALARFTAFVAARHQVTDVPAAIALLAGVAVPPELLERDLLPLRVAGYQGALLDAACAAGGVAWWLDGARVRLAPRDELGAWHTPGPDPAEDDAAERAILDALASGALFATELLARTGLDPQALWNAVWSLGRRGRVTGDAFEALRRASAAGFAPAPEELAPGRADAGVTIRGASPLVGQSPTSLPRARWLQAVPRRGGRPSPWVGRFAALADPPWDPASRARHQAEALLDRFGVVGRALIDVDPGAGLEPWGALEAAFTELELRAEVVRGRFVEGLGGWQVARATDVDALRAHAPDVTPRLVSALDPIAAPALLALPYETRPARAATTHLVLVAGAAAVISEAHAKRLTVAPDAPAEAISALAALLRAPPALRPARSLTVHEVNGRPAVESAALLEQAGFHRDGDRHVLGVLDAESLARPRAVR